MAEFDDNRKLAAIFHNMAEIYSYLGTGERFRALAYEKAARVIGSLPEDVSIDARQHKLEEIPGIGEGIAGKIEEFFATGRIRKYEELQKMAPHELLGMLDISGFGPKSLKRIHTELKINTKEQLVKALKNGRIAKMKGFGPKKVESMLRGLKLHKTVEERMLLWDALQTAELVTGKLKQLPYVRKVEVAGSIRRMKETIGDIDLLVSCLEEDRNKVADYFTGPHIANSVIAKGNTKASIIQRETGKQVDMRIIKENEWGSALQYFTGSKEHNVHLRTIARNMGYKINEYGVFSMKDGKRLAGKTEEEIYGVLKFQIMPPEMREDKGEIELAAKSRIPRLITNDDIKGDLHCHSVWSDGLRNIEEIAEYLMHNFRYEYFVISDHSKSTRVANGMDEKLALKQIREVERINDKLGIDFIKKGMEIDILPDGKLDIADDVLAQLDWVTASVHSNFKSDNTERIIRACENKYVCSIGHPTGRLIGSREPYKLDAEALFKAAKATGTALEINSQPQRMDLNDELVMSARQRGVTFVVTTDSHDLGQFSYMKLGIAIARRGWCSASDILNANSWNAIADFTRKKRAGSKVAML